MWLYMFINFKQWDKYLRYFYTSIFVDIENNKKMANEREAKAMEAATDALSGRLAELKSSAGIQSLYFFREGVSRGGVEGEERGFHF